MPPDTTAHSTEDRQEADRTFDLVGLYDDPDAPTEYTVYPRDADAEELTSRWLSVAAEDTISLDEMR